MPAGVAHAVLLNCARQTGETSTPLPGINASVKVSIDTLLLYLSIIGNALYKLESNVELPAQSAYNVKLNR